MINHFNFIWRNGEVLVTNDFGDYAFLKKDEFQALVTNRVHKGTELYELLSARGFVTDDDPSVFILERIGELRNIKGYLLSSTALHIFSITNRCNQNCVYCQAKAPGSTLDGVMDAETGRKAIEVAMQSPSLYLTFEFQGGEPLLNFEVMKEMIRHSKELNKQYKKNIEYTVVSNLIALTDEKLDYLLRFSKIIITQQEINTSSILPCFLYLYAGILNRKREEEQSYIAADDKTEKKK